MFRQLIQLEGSTTNSSLPNLDVTPQEIAVAQLSGIAAWPALFTWGVNPATTGVVDRLTDTDSSANGATAIAARFAVGGTPALSGYSTSATNQAIIGPLEMASGFTIGFVARTNLCAGSYSSGTNSWWIVSDNITASPTIGALRFSMGGITSTYAEYVSGGGKVMNGNDWERVVLIVDRTAGTMTLRVNGVQVVQKAGLSAGATILNEFAIGVFNAGSQSIRAAQYRSPILFSRPVSGTDLTTLEAMLASAAIV